MSIAEAEALFTTPRLDVVFLSPALAQAADQVMIATPKYSEAEFDSQPKAGFVAELLDAPAPPGVSKVAVFPMGLREKGQEPFMGLAHLVLGYPTETALFLGMFIIAASHQRKGYGKEFIEGLYDWSRPQGIGFIRARVHPRNTDAKAFYDKLGFADLPAKLSTGHEVWERHLPAVEED